MTTHTTPEHTAQQPENATKVAKVYISIFAYTTLIFVLIFGTVWFFIRAQDTSNIQRVVGRPHIEALIKPHQLDVSFELGHDSRVLMEEQNKKLENYTWVDKEAGIVSMPIEKAMDKIAGESSSASTSPNPESVSTGTVPQISTPENPHAGASKEK